MRRAKIVCTIGPASNSKDIIYRLIKAGMDVARLNFSHGTHTEHKEAIEIIRTGARRYNSPVAILQDLKGLKLRVGSIRGGAITLKKGSILAITTDEIVGNPQEISISYPHLIKDVEIGDKILMDDGLIQLRIVEKEKNKLITKVIEGGILREKKGVNLPRTKISGSSFTEKDKEDLAFGIKMGVDYVAVSFVRSKDDILKVKNWLKNHGSDIPVIAKIETPQALENINEIIDVSDGLMIARGDMGVELPPEKVPLIQKHLIQQCNKALKPVITATQMLESMTEHMRPTRAEAADIANAVLDGTDALMLSAETAIGKYPVEALKMMDRIIRATEKEYLRIKDRSRLIAQGSSPTGFAQAIAEAACMSAVDIKAKAIVAFSKSGFTALLVSKFRPPVSIIGFTVKEETLRRMSLYWGITPQVMRFPSSTDEMISESESALLKRGFVKKGEPIVIIATSPFALGGKTNILKLHRVGG
jgi:pyruvate kinase